LLARLKARFACRACAAPACCDAGCEASCGCEAAAEPTCGCAG
jgi:hypothetical protein